MDPSSNVSVSFDPAEIEAALSQSAQKISPLQQVAPQPQEAPPQEQPSVFGGLSTLANHALDLGKGVASVLDNTVGGVLPFIAKQATYAGGRAFGQTPEEAEQTSNQAFSYFNQPFGSALGITNDPAYKNESTSQLLDYVGQNIGQGSQWIANQTGLPVQDVENMVNTMLGASGEIAGPVAKTVAKEAANKAFMGESLVPKSLQQFLPEVSALGIMEGRSSRNWSSKAENDFLNNERQGISPHANLAMTGVLRGPDNMLRQQISDKNAQVKLHESLIPRKDLTLSDVYDHPKLYDSYPWLKNVPVIFREDLPDRSMGGYSPISNHIYLNAKHINNATEMKKTFGHEVSHIIQQAEGFGRGGNEAMFPVTQDIADAKELETYMNAANISAKDAADLFQATHKRRPSEVAVNYANSGQASMVPYLSPTKRYEHILGEIEARLSENRMGLTDEELRQYYPYEYNPQNFSSGIPEKKNYGIENDIDLNHALIHAGYDAKGKHIFMTAPEWRRSQAAREKLAAREAPTPDEMRAELALKPSEDMMSVKEKGGNWPESWLDRNMERLKKSIPEFDTSKSYTQDQANYISNRFPGIQDAYAMDFRQSGKHGMDYGKDFWPWMEKNFPNELKELVNKQTTGHALNNWVDKRLKPYIKNDLGTPADPVRELADQGISHIKDLEEQQPISKAAVEARQRNKMPTEGYAKTPAGKAWENRSDTVIYPLPAKDFIGDYMATSMRHPDLLAAAERDPNAKIHQLSSDYDTELGFDHLMDELRSSLTGNVPQHLALTPKTLERMTMSDAVRHVSKVNDWREKQMAKTAAEDMKYFPPMKVYDNGYKWHELKMPDVDHPLDEGHELVQFMNEHDNTVHNIVDKKTGKHLVSTTKHPEHAMEEYSNQKNYDLLEKALKNEGDLMGHCVGSYCPEVASGEKRIFTLRDNKNRPHVTIEATPEIQIHSTGDFESPTGRLDIQQIKGKANQAVNDKYHSYVHDFLNSTENLGDVNDLHYVNTVDTHKIASAPTESPNKINVSRLIKENPNLPRFMNADELHKMVQDLKPKGHKKGGKIAKMNTGGVTPASDIPPTPEKRNPNTTDYVKPKTVDPGFAEVLERVRNTPKPSGGVGYVPGTTNPFNPDSPLNRKRGGRVNIDQMKLELAMRN